MPYDTLLVYLTDHLAGARAALELVEHIRDHATDSEIKLVMAELHDDMAVDRDTLIRLAERLGGSASTLKDASAWLAEKLSRLKLGALGAKSPLPLFEAVEAIGLGILGKIALWDNLLALSTRDPTFRMLPYEELGNRAVAQHARVEALRLRLTYPTFVEN
jgi:hypothetical protein